jgi:protein-S-isoprenylcysteine O-methyltransferase Ste14
MVDDDRKVADFIQRGREQEDIRSTSSTKGAHQANRVEVAVRIVSSPAPLVVLIATILTLAAARSLFSSSPWVIAAQAAAIGLSVWARLSFTADAFRVVAVPGAPMVIRQGPYRFVRHPMYAAALLSSGPPS